MRSGQSSFLHSVLSVASSLKILNTPLINTLLILRLILSTHLRKSTTVLQSTRVYMSNRVLQYTLYVLQNI